MANTIKLKTSAVAGKVPTTSDLELRELALNTYDGKLYAKKDNGTESIVELSGVPDGSVTNTKVASDAAIAGTKISPNFGSQNVVTTGTATAAALVPSGSSVPTNGVYLPSANNVAISSNSSERIRITSDGKLGLGTSTVNAKLHINTATTGDEALRLQNAGGVERIQAFLSTGSNEIRSANGTFLLNSLDSTLQLQTGGTTRAFIDASGRLGIGTTSPASALHVDSNTTLDVLRITKTTTDTSTIGNAILIFTQTSGTAAAGLGSRINFITENSNGINYETAYISAGTSSTGGNKDGFISFATAFSQTNPAERVRIDSSGRLLIGTSSDSKQSTVVIQGNTGGSTLAGVIRVTRGTSSPADGNALGALYFGDSNHNESAGVLAARDGGTWTSGSSEPTRLVFSTTADGASSPTERMRITSNAYVRLASGTGGIQFNGDTAAANALDDYEEGTWGDSGTMSNRRYVKIGRLVHLTIEAALAGSGAAFSKSLPFALEQSTAGFSAIEVGSWFVRTTGGSFPIYIPATSASLYAQGAGIVLRKAGTSSAITLAEINTAIGGGVSVDSIFASFSYYAST